MTGVTGRACTPSPVRPPWASSFLVGGHFKCHHHLPRYRFRLQKAIIHSLALLFQDSPLLDIVDIFQQPLMSSIEQVMGFHSSVIEGRISIIFFSQNGRVTASFIISISSISHSIHLHLFTLFSRHFLDLHTLLCTWVSNNSIEHQRRSVRIPLLIFSCV